MAEASPLKKMFCCCKPEIRRVVVMSKKRCVNGGERVALILEDVQDVKRFLYCRLCILKDFFLNTELEN